MHPSRCGSEGNGVNAHKQDQGVAPLLTLVVPRAWPPGSPLLPMRVSQRPDRNAMRHSTSATCKGTDGDLPPLDAGRCLPVGCIILPHYSRTQRRGHICRVS